MVRYILSAVLLALAADIAFFEPRVVKKLERPEEPVVHRVETYPSA